MDRSVEFGGVRYAWGWWAGDRLTGSAERPLAFDCETELIAGPLHVPRLALAMAFDGSRLVLIHPDRVGDFVAAHRGEHWVGHNLAFDFWVAHEHLAASPSRQRLLWDAGERNRLHDTQVLDQLLQLATGRYHGRGLKGDDVRLVPANLAVVCGLNDVPLVDKDDPYRLRFGELLGLDQAAIDAHPEFAGGFASYALGDVIATWLVYPVQRAKAIDAMRRVGWAAGHRDATYEIRGDALERWGPLTEAIQVKASIVLAELSRTPLRIDRVKRAELEAAARAAYESCYATLDADAPGLFKRYTAKRFEGRHRMTKRSLVPQMDQGVLKRTLQTQADRLGFAAPISDGKKQEISTSAKAWAKFADRSPFVAAWCELEKHAKLLEFLRTLDADAVYSRYNLLMRTGRTSAGAHREKGKQALAVPSLNVQQMPRESDVRSLFVAADREKLAPIDYSFIELRTLAASANAKFGYSSLKEAVVEHTTHGGVDPHQRTAAQIRGLSVVEFLRLPKDEQKADRQKAKACFHADTELLTRQGWMRITDVRSDTEVAQFWPGCDRIDYAKPLALTVREGRQLVRVSNEGIDLRVTPDHRMLGRAVGGHPRVVFPSEMNLLRDIWNAGFVTEGVRCGATTLADVRRAVCIQADGSLTTSDTAVRFGFKKKRKIERFRELFPDATERVSSQEGVTEFRVAWKGVYESLLTTDKRFRTDRLLAMPQAWRVAFMEELRHWDGHSSKTTRRFTYSTVVKENADAVQAVATTVGLKATIQIQRQTDERRSDLYVVSVKFRNYSRGGNFTVEPLPGEHTVYCLSMPSSYVIARDGGKVVCVGQCNFGFPGGLGVQKFRDYAAASYGQAFTAAEARSAKKAWIATYPEMNDWLADSTRAALRWQLGEAVGPILNRLSDWQVRQVIDVLRGSETQAPANQEMGWELLETLVVAAKRFPLLAAVYDRERTPELKQLTTYRATTLTGRVRANVKYTDERNSPFQGLAADGAKLALWSLRYNGFRLWAFVHDEVVLSLPAATAERDARRAERLMNEAMESVLDGVPSAVEGHVADCWTKP